MVKANLLLFNVGTRDVVGFMDDAEFLELPRVGESVIVTNGQQFGVASVIHKVAGPIELILVDPDAMKQAERSKG